jgi:hypothetical protein
MLKRNFSVALAYADTTMSEWAERHGFGKSNVSNVLAGRGKSEPIVQAIRDFTAEQLALLAKELTEAA